MPVSPEFAVSNRTQTERLHRLVARLTPEQYRVRLPNGWTVSGALAHVAVWDRQRLCLMRRWAAVVECHGNYDGEVFNEALQPVLELIPPERVAAFAIQTAEEIDAFLLAVSDEVVAAALARPDKPNLDRGSHREYHLDQIERAVS
jgi:DinB superfamily